MSSNLSKRGIQLYRSYVEDLNSLIKQMVFPIYSATFYECDCDVAWAQHLYRTAAEGADLWTKLKYKFIAFFLPADRTYVRQLCFIDSIVGLSYMELYTITEKAILDSAIERLEGFMGKVLECDQKQWLKCQEDLVTAEKNLADIAKTKSELFELYCIDYEEIEEWFKMDTLSQMSLCTKLVDCYADMSKHKPCLNAFGHQAMGGIKIDDFSRLRG